MSGKWLSDQELMEITSLSGVIRQSELIQRLIGGYHILGDILPKLVAELQELRAEQAKATPKSEECAPVGEIVGFVEVPSAQLGPITDCKILLSRPTRVTDKTDVLVVRKDAGEVWPAVNEVDDG